MSEVKLSEVLLDNQNKRIDSEYFKKQFLRFFCSVPNLKPLGNFVKEGYRVIYENTEILPSAIGREKDYPFFLQATDLETPFIRTDDLSYVHESDWLRYSKGRIKAGELLIEVKGKIEKVSLVPDDFPSKTLVTGSLYKLNVNERINKHFLLAYLISKYGVAFKERYKTNLLISFISKEDLYRIPVPDLSFNFQIRIEEIFKRIFEKHRDAKRIDTVAETLLLENLGLKDFQPSAEGVSIRSFQDSFGTSGRLDAEYYQPKYADWTQAVCAYPLGSTSLGTVCEVKEKNFMPEPCNTYAYIELSDIDKAGGITGATMEQGQALPTRARRKVATGDVLVSSIEGSLASCALVPDKYNGALCSTGFYVIRSERINAETLLVLMKSTPMQALLKQRCSGTILTAINSDAFLSLPMPLIDLPTQEKIAQHIQQSFTHKAESERLLNVAKRAVELAIEQDESAGVRYLEAHTNGTI